VVFAFVCSASVALARCGLKLNSDTVRMTIEMQAFMLL
jgi:hypothetical protein